MRTATVAFTLFLMITVAGCGRHKRGASVPEPLTIETWSSLPVETKYEVPTLERLKEGNPKLQDDREWDEFMRNILIPARMKELPNGVPGK